MSTALSNRPKNLRLLILKREEYGYCILLSFSLMGERENERERERRKKIRFSPPPPPCPFRSLFIYRNVFSLALINITFILIVPRLLCSFLYGFFFLNLI